MATKSPVPKKVSISTLIIYGVIAVILLVLCVMLGAAMDLAVKPDGKLDISLIGSGFEKIIGKPEQVIKAMAAMRRRWAFSGLLRSDYSQPTNMLRAESGCTGEGWSMVVQNGVTKGR